MASRRRQVVASSPAAGGSFASGLGNLPGLAEHLGESLGRGIARGLNVGLGGPVGPAASPVANLSAPRRGRIRTAGKAPAGHGCTVDGCTNPVRSKGLCSKHYQAERRRLAKLA